MCGIAGIVSKERQIDIKDRVSTMLETIVHRGPDGVGVKQFENQICIGHRRLAIIDLSVDGLQPMCKKERYWITFNGEIYNYIELKHELEESGVVFDTKTDTEVLLESYIRWGEDCVNHFNGMWAFAIYDSLEKKLFCSRDRYGVKPFYYEFNENGFFFGSEIKEILSIKKPDSIIANRRNLIGFLVNGTLDYNEDTMFQGIKQLLGGDNLIFNCKTFELKKYTWYDLTNVELNNNKKEINYKLFREKFEKAIGLRLRADVPIGSCLSGGLDSSSIVCAIHEELKKQKKESNQFTISSCFEDKDYDEREYIDAVVNSTGVVSYRVFPKMKELLPQLDEIIWHMDEPFAGTSIFAQWNVFKVAKEHSLTVMLDGQGADEQLAGYTPFYKVLFIDLLKHGRFGDFVRELKAYKELRADFETIRTWELVVSTILTICVPDSLRFWLNKVFRNKQRGYPFPNYFYDNEVAKIGWISYDKRNSQKYINAGLHYGIRALLHYEDRNSMAHSIESRVPFLDYDLTEFVYSIPFSQKIENGRTKNILREGLKDILPESIYNRYSKLGFATPEDKWIKENETYIGEELSNACDVLGGLIDKRQVMDWYRVNAGRLRRGDSTCFRIICAARWVKVFNVLI